MSEPFDSWAVVEVMGHRVFAGRVTEQVIAGAGFVRVDVPRDSQHEPFTKMIGTASIYAITPCSEAVARKAAAQNQERPVEVWGMCRALPARSDCEDDDGGDYQDDGPADGELF